MASVSGSKLAFFVPGQSGDNVNIVLTPQVSDPFAGGDQTTTILAGTPVPPPPPPSPFTPNSSPDLVVTDVPPGLLQSTLLNLLSQPNTSLYNGIVLVDSNGTAFQLQGNILVQVGNVGISGGPVAGKFNIEVFTSAPGTLAAGFQASAFIQGAKQLTNNVVQAATFGSTEKLLAGNFQMIDQTGSESIVLGSGNQTVTGSAGDTITGGTVPGSSQLIDISGTNLSVNKGPAAMTAIGGAGNTTVWAGNSDSISGGSGAMTVTGAVASDVKITGGTGNLTVFNLIGTGNSVTGSTTGFTFVDDNYGGSGNTIGGGGGNGPGTDASGGTFVQGTEIIGAKGDVINGGSGTMLVNALNGGMTVTGGSGPATVWGAANDMVTGGSGTLQFTGGTGSTLTGGTGALNAFNLGAGNTIGGGSSTSVFIDDSYGGGSKNLLTGGAGASRIIGGSGDTLVGGAGALQAEIKTGFGTETVNLSASGSADGVRDVASVGGGTAASVTGFSTANDVIESMTNVTAGGVFTGSSSSSLTGTTLTFTDGNTMFIAGVLTVGAIKFTQ